MLVSDLQRSAPGRAELLRAQLRETLEANRALELPARLALPATVVALASEIRALAPDRVDTLLAQLLGALEANRALEFPARLALRCGIVSLASELEKLLPNQIELLLGQLCEGLRPDSSEETRYRVAEALTSAVYPKYKFSDYSRVFLEDEEFLSYYQQFMDANNWHSLDRKYTLDQLLKLIRHLDGDVAEAGTYKGFSAFRMCLALQGTDRLVHLFDSFAGLSEPEPIDGDYWSPGRFEASEEAVHKTLQGFGNYRLYKGWIPERFSEVADRRFSFVHIDVDLYRPTRESLEFFYERVIPSGLILFDDYGMKTCPGHRAAADEFFRARPEPIVMLPTGQAFVIKRTL